MFRTIIFSAFGAAVILCAVLTGLQTFMTEPLILEAERYESGPATHPHEPDAVAGHDREAEAWSPGDGLERRTYTAFANLVVGFAVSLMLLGVMTMSGTAISGRQGMLWGLAGFFALALLPSLGLPPELPGTPAADIVDRQVWWLGTAAASAGGLALLALAGTWPARGLGLALIVLPHLVGAPVPPSHDVAFPGGLAGEFVVASLAVSAALWIGAGLSAGWLHRRLTAPA